MKKITLFLLCGLMLPIATYAKKEKALKVLTFENCSIYAQSGRNSDKKGSALSLTTGITYSMERADQRDIDVMLYYGKVNGSKVKFFSLFAPENPTISIDWEKDGGTSPYCKFEGKSDDPDAYYALKNWRKRNATKMERIEGVDFENITGEALMAMKVDDSYMVTDVKDGDIILFEMAETSYKPGRKGLIRITSAQNDDPTKPDKKGNGPNQFYTLDVKIVK